MQGAAAYRLSGNRLHLQHGPIDLILKAEGRDAAMIDRVYAGAERRFRPLLRELVAELTDLRRPGVEERAFSGMVAQRMQRAIRPHLPGFVTPMAAVAGAVADEILAAARAEAPELRIWANNGGDIAFARPDGAPFRSAIPGIGVFETTTGLRQAGLSSSGWRGRSHSLGIADCVTVLAPTAAAADVAATLIANAVDLPGHAAIGRRPAAELAPDSDLGMRLVTVSVGALTPEECSRALDAGQGVAKHMQSRGLIHGALLALGAGLRMVGEGQMIEAPVGV
ncbi:MAG: UPF0280 family protein [Pseudomonadota bacterium]